MKSSTLIWTLLGATALALTLTACGNSSSGPAGDDENAVAADKAEQLHADFLVRTIDHVVMPGYAELLANASAMLDESESFCADRSEPAFEALRTQWRAAMAAWQAMRWMNKGPVNFGYRFQRFEGWPRASAAAVKTRVDLLVAQAGSATAETMDVALIEKQPVQAQGFPALEYLLFDGRGAADFSDDPTGNRRCQMLVAVAGNLQMMAAAIHENWTNPELRDSVGRGVLGLRNETLDTTFNTMVNQIRQALITMRHEQLGGPLGITVPGQTAMPNRYALQSALSQTSLAHILVALDEIKKLMAADGGDYAGLLKAFAKEPVAVKFDELLDQATGLVNGLLADGISLKAAVTTPALTPRAVALYDQVRAVDEYFQDSVMPGVGAKPTFNFNDGD